MQINLLDITTDELLEKFGAGSHKPGSGSAAAFQGMLSAKLLITVISLTIDVKRRSKYKVAYPTLVKMDNEIKKRIFPELTKLFNDDAMQFGKTIKARKERNQEKDPFKNHKLARKALDELKESIEIPLSIGKLCVELAEIAEFVFDNGFQSARGDSQVALSGSVAGIAGCLSIIQLNLLSFGSDEYGWTSQKNIEAASLKDQYKRLLDIADAKIEILEIEVEDKERLYGEIDNLLKDIKSKTKLSNKDIEKAASDLQNIIWSNREIIWQDKVPNHPAEILKPSTVFQKALAYKFAKTDQIENPENFDLRIAGIINQKEKVVVVSQEFDKNIQNFTAAHELGHALMHNQDVMHRDRPVDGVKISEKRSLEEYQADKFSSYFLMPKNIVKKEFQRIFGTDHFVINEETVFNFSKHSESELKFECKNLRGLALKLASTERYANVSFTSMANLFQVSPTAMAIRLEELGLLEF